MDVDSSQPEPAYPLSSFARSLQERRERLQSQSAAQRERLGQLEARILAQIDQAARDLGAAREAALSRQTQIDRHAGEDDTRSAALTARAAELDRLALELDRRQTELSAREKAITSRDEEREAKHAEWQRELARQAKELPERLAEVERRETELERRQAALAERAQAAEEAEAAAQRTYAAAQQLQAAARDARISLEKERQAAEDDLSRRQAKLASQREELDAAVAKLAADECAASEQREVAEKQLAAAKKQLEDRQNALNAETARLAADREEHAAALAALRQAERALAAERQTSDQELALVKRQYEERTAGLERQRQSLAEDQERTLEQRRRIAEQLKRERDLGQQLIAGRLADLEALASQGNSAHEALLADARRETTSLSERLRERGEELDRAVAAHMAAQAQIAALTAQLDEATRKCSAGVQQAGTVQDELNKAQDALSKAQGENAALRQQVAELEAGQERDLRESSCEDRGPSQSELRARELAERLTAERDDLVRRLADAEAALVVAKSPDGGNSDESSSAEFADLTQRYEMAVRDIRELKKKNEELEKRSAGAGRAAAPATGVSMDWEARKRQLLASLEADEGEEPEEERRDEIVRIENVVRETDAELRKRDEEIEELRRQLEEQGAGVSVSAATPAPNVADILDKDELIMQERARIKQLEKEWEEKLRQAEIDLSVQRAQLARAQAEVAERQRTLEDQGVAPHEPRVANDPANKSKKQQRGRWLSRLGLADEEK